MNQIIIKHGQEGRKKLLTGASKVGELVGSSLGPKGRNSIIKVKYSAPQIFNDGVSIARNIMLDDEIEDLGAQTLIEGSMKIDERAGDGTTGGTVIASKIVHDYAKKIEEEDSSCGQTGTIGEANGVSMADVNSMAREILDTGNLVVKKLKEKATKLKKDELKNVVSSSLGLIYPEYTDTITEIVEKIGKDGYIDVDDNWATKYGVETEVVEGLKHNGTYITPYMCTNKKKEAIQEDVHILVCNSDFATSLQINEVLKQIIHKGIRKLVIIANKFEKPYIKTLAATAIQARNGDTRLIDFLAIKTPALDSDKLKDVAIFCGARFFDKNVTNVSLEKASFEDLGFAKKVIVDENYFRILGGKGSKDLLMDRIMTLQTEAEADKDPAFKKQTERRIASLKSGNAVIRVGGSTEGERQIVKKKIEDAVNSAQCALEEGVVKGGGLALKEIADELGKEHSMYEALCEPYNRIQQSAGGKLEIPETVLDPLKVIRIAVETACSVASSLITAEIGIASKTKTLWDELDSKLNPQMGVKDDFRENENNESYQ